MPGFWCRDEARRKIEEWLRTDVVAAYDAFRANPESESESAVPLDEVRASLAAEYAKTSKRNSQAPPAMRN
jgi:hypothetical protein